MYEMKRDVAFGEMMADRWQDFVVESYQLVRRSGLPVDCLMLPSITVSHGDTCCAWKYFQHRSAGNIMLG